MSKRKIGQWVFDLPECPKDATCVAVDGDGFAYWYKVPPAHVDWSVAAKGWVPDTAIYGTSPDTAEFIGTNFCADGCEHSKVIRENKMEMMPILEFGDVVKYEDGKYGIVTKTLVYDLHCEDGYVCPNRNYLKEQGATFIVAVYRADRDYGFLQPELRNICDGYGWKWIIWKRPEVKEMTVDQISEALGYKVKVVGNDVGR